MTKGLSLSITTAAAISALSFSANAVVLIGGDYDEEALWEIDTDAETVTLIGDPDLYGPETQLTPDESTVLLSDTSGYIHRLDSADGSLIGTTAITFPPATVDDDWNTVTAMEYIGGTLYVSFDESGPESGPGLFGTLNPMTGATTEIGMLTGMNAPTGGLAYDGGTLYAVSSANSEYSQLYTVNIATGAATLVADITFEGNQVEAMTALVIADGVAYTKSNDTTGGVDDYYLYSLDLSTGELTELFELGGEWMVSLTAAPVPPSRDGGPGGPLAVPTMGLWGIGILSGMIGLLGMYHRRRK